MKPRTPSEEARARPGLKQQTPHEEKAVSQKIQNDRKRWEYLLSLNAWKPTK
jgi:hypothetical protein